MVAVFSFSTLRYCVEMHQAEEATERSVEIFGMIISPEP